MSGRGKGGKVKEKAAKSRSSCDYNLQFQVAKLAAFIICLVRDLRLASWCRSACLSNRSDRVSDCRIMLIIQQEPTLILILLDNLPPGNADLRFPDSANKFLTVPVTPERFRTVGNS